jgi:hypothetical protein
MAKAPKIYATAVRVARFGVFAGWSSPLARTFISKPFVCDIPILN